MAYYGIFIPSNGYDEGYGAEPHVYVDKIEALKNLKKLTDGGDARLSVFKSYEEAESFSLHGSLVENKSRSKSKTKINIASSNSSSTAATNSTTTPAPPVSKFRSPKSQELVQFRKAIESGNLELVKSTLNSNPRYLISSGDTPSILKEGTRYNAMHVAALHNKSEICLWVLSLVSKPAFIAYFHNTPLMDHLETFQNISSTLFDLYINMPEKGRSDTPLHLAVKYGHVEVVKVLTSYPQCKMSPNLDGFYPKDVVCSRMPNPTKEANDAIIALLQERFYVPVIRSEDSTTPPIIGAPFSPANPPELNTDPLSPKVKIEAIAGPMEEKQAHIFRRRWKTPPRLNLSSPTRSLNNSFSSPIRSPYKFGSSENSSTPIICKSRRLFPNKSFDSLKTQDSIEEEVVECGIGILEPEIDEVPIILEESVIESTILNSCSFDLGHLSLNESIRDTSFKERNVKLSDAEKGLEVIGRTLAKEHNVGWNEYWAFLGTFIDFTTSSGLEQLEKYLNKNATGSIDSVPKVDDLFSVNALCDALNDFKISSANGLSNKYNNKDTESFLTSSSSPTSIKVHCCVEKSCQIFAKRFTQTFGNKNDISVTVIVERLEKEMKRLHSLVASYSTDFRFKSVNFRLMHSRFATLVMAYLKKEDYEKTVLDSIRKCLNEMKELHVDECLKCLCRRLHVSFDEIDGIEPPELIFTEKECEVAWNNESACSCNMLVDTQIHHLKKSRHKKTKSASFKPNELNQDLWAMRDTTKEYEDETEVYFTGSEGQSSEDDDRFFTPPETPEELIDAELFLGAPKLNLYTNYILGEEPTKTDVDVLNAIKDTDIDESQYPLVTKWRDAVLQFSTEERESFPAPSLVKSRLSLGPVKTTIQRSPTLISRQLFSTIQNGSTMNLL